MDGLTIVTVYGASKDIRINGRSVKMPTLAEVLALNPTSFQLEVSAIDAEPMGDDRTSEKWDNSKFVRNKEIFSAKPTGLDEDYTVASSFESFFGTNTINKAYKWIHIPNYNLMPEGYDDTKVLAINIDSRATTHTHEGGTKAKSFRIFVR